MSRQRHKANFVIVCILYCGLVYMLILCGLARVFNNAFDTFTYLLHHNATYLVIPTLHLYYNLLLTFPPFHSTNKSKE